MICVLPVHSGLQPVPSGVLALGENRHGALARHS
jgi:hypothetical protein